MLIATALIKHLFQAVLANVTVLNGVGGDEGGETAGPQQAVNAADEIGNQVAETGGRVFPFNVFAECMTIRCRSDACPPRYGGLPRMQSNPPAR